jgi:hypothetical protein
MISEPQEIMNNPFERLGGRYKHGNHPNPTRHQQSHLQAHLRWCGLSESLLQKELRRRSENENPEEEQYLKATP